MQEQISIENLFNQLLSEGARVFKHKDYDLIECDDLKIKTIDNKYVGLVCISRHKTCKHLLKITASAGNKFNEVKTSIVVTTDHICMIYNKDHFFENLSAKHLKVGQYVSIYDPGYDKELIGTITQIEDLGETSDYVYDCEVDDEMHSFYANDVLVHNSQFINLQCISDYVKEKNGLKKTMYEWPKKYKREVWDLMTDLTDNYVNPSVRKLAQEYCHTSEQNVLTYELEYMTDRALFESKKHYYIHQCIVEGDDEDHIKVSGIELKKASVPKEMKQFLNDVYYGTVCKNWSEKEYQDYINDLYDKFTKFSINEISFWKGYNTERESIGFLQYQVGVTGIAKSVINFNQIIQKMGLGAQYGEIIVGSMVRQCYLKDSNPYNIDTIAFPPDKWPKEFNDIFEIDYHKMFQKIILDPLKNFRKACNIADTDPSKQVEFDIFQL